MEQPRSQGPFSTRSRERTLETRLRRLEPHGFDVRTFARYDWSVAKKIDLASITSLESYKHVPRSLEIFCACTVLSHGSVMLTSGQPLVSARLACWQLIHIVIVMWSLLWEVIFVITDWNRRSLMKQRSCS